MEPQQQSDSPAAKPENHAPPPPPPQSKESGIFFRWFLMGMFGFYLLFGSSVLTVWIVVRPRAPVLVLDQASVNLTAHSNTNISGTWGLGFQIRNPNSKIRISYDNLTVFLSPLDQGTWDQTSMPYDNLTVFQADIPEPLPPFHQGTRNQTSIGASSFLLSTRIGDWDWNWNGSNFVSFTARIEGNVTFRLGGWRPRRRSLAVECQDVLIHIPANATSGKMAGGAQECSVEF